MTQVRSWWSGFRHQLAQHWLVPSTLLLSEPDSDFDGRSERRTLRDWFVDIGCVLLACAWGAVVTANSELDSELDWFNVICGAIACLALWFRRRAPVVLAVVMLPLAMASSVAALADMIALFTVAVHRHYLVPIALGVAHAATQAIYSAVVPGEWGNYLFVLLVYAAVIAVGMFVRARRQLVLSLNERVRQAEADAALREERAKELERQRIAREMHDVLAHRISLLSMHAGALEYRKDAEPEELTQAVAVIRSSAHQILRDLRDVIGVLRTGPADDAPQRPQPTLADLPALVEESRLSNSRVELDNRITDLDAVPATLGRSAYRIVQEGLTNARKHAPGCLVEMTVSGSPEDGLSIVIGNRLPVSRRTVSEIPGGGLGLIGMKERAHLAGGWLEHERDESWFRLSAWLPWND
ncbi:sensor histidine kinase [Saccharomonospora azurea]|uniref:sensor histidine kinase n=1 Tax=Saccharomonospora azurea TaxID=40988 RepID=UPI00240A0F1A|nr:histidine kinase [Saccharomonospora azurea]